MQVRIAHLYYDLMNLYGESGNILALKHHLSKHKCNVVIDNLSIMDDINFELYDFFYIGSGNEEALCLCAKHINKYREKINKAISGGKFFLVSGNAICLFGKNYFLENSVIKTLNIFDFEAHKIDFRIVGEQTLRYKELKQEIIGFNNRDCILKFVKEPFLFEVKKGTGYVPKSIVEGIKKHNFYGTFLLGPILIRNPFFTEYLIKQIFKAKKYKYTYYKDYLEEKAYSEYLKNVLYK